MVYEAIRAQRCVALRYVAINNGRVQIEKKKKQQLNGSVNQKENKNDIQNVIIYQLY